MKIGVEKGLETIQKLETTHDVSNVVDVDDGGISEVVIKRREENEMKAPLAHPDSPGPDVAPGD